MAPSTRPSPGCVAGHSRPGPPAPVWPEPQAGRPSALAAPDLPSRHEVLGWAPRGVAGRQEPAGGFRGGGRMVISSAQNVNRIQKIHASRELCNRAINHSRRRHSAESKCLIRGAERGKWGPARGGAGGRTPLLALARRSRHRSREPPDPSISPAPAHCALQQPLIHSFIHSQPLAHSLIHSFFHLFTATRSFAHSLIHSFTAGPLVTAGQSPFLH